MGKRYVVHPSPSAVGGPICQGGHGRDHARRPAVARPPAYTLMRGFVLCLTSVCDSIPHGSQWQWGTTAS
eukprot:11222582-Lingulodinium_polyedra.AAC.1